MTSNDNVLRTLVLSLDYPNRASYYDDWKDAFCSHPGFRCTQANIMRLGAKSLAKLLAEHDAVIALHSCNGDTLEYLEPLVPVLRDRRHGAFLSFVGNEYNSPYVSVERRTGLLHEARCDIIATQLLQEAGDYLYGGGPGRVLSVPHALNPRVFRPGRSGLERKLDLAFRGWRYPPFLGDDDRNVFINKAARLAPELGLAVDIGEDSRLDRDGWATFLASSRGTISTETGSWFVSPSDELGEKARAFLATRRRGLVIPNDGVIRRTVRYLPSGLKSKLWSIAKLGPVKFEVQIDNTVAFEEVYEAIFRDLPRAPVYGKAISSRHFDAIGTKTCQIMPRGRFNDILTPGEHYIAVEPDMSDLGDALYRFKDEGVRREIVDRTYELALDQHTYAHRAELVHKAISAL